MPNAVRDSPTHLNQLLASPPVGDDSDARSVAAGHALAELENFRKKHPPFAALVKVAVVALKREVRRTPNRDRAAVMRSIRRGYASLDDIQDDTQLDIKELQRILHELLNEGAISLRRFYAKAATTNTGKGAPRLIYVTSDTPAGDVYESPSAQYDSATAAVCDALNR